MAPSCKNVETKKCDKPKIGSLKLVYYQAYRDQYFLYIYSVECKDTSVTRHTGKIHIPLKEPEPILVPVYNCFVNHYLH